MNTTNREEAMTKTTDVETTTRDDLASTRGRPGPEPTPEPKRIERPGADEWQRREHELKDALRDAKATLQEEAARARTRRNRAKDLRGQLRRSAGGAHERLDVLLAAAPDEFATALANSSWWVNFTAGRAMGDRPEPGLVVLHELATVTDGLSFAERLHAAVDRSAAEDGAALIADDARAGIEKEIAGLEKEAEAHERAAKKADDARDAASKELRRHTGY